MVKTDIAIAIPPGTYARIAPRSGLAVKHFIDTGKQQPPCSLAHAARWPWSCRLQWPYRETPCSNISSFGKQSRLPLQQHL